MTRGVCLVSLSSAQSPQAGIVEATVTRGHMSVVRVAPAHGPRSSLTSGGVRAYAELI